jgi:hypothetical protein
MKNDETGTSKTKREYLPDGADLPKEELLYRKRINALIDHQNSVAEGDILVSILKNTIAQVEKAHTRIKWMSTALFVTGIVVLLVGIFYLVFGKAGQEVWSAILSGVGGFTTLAATFWTAPLDRINQSIEDLVSLETAFLGYIRIIGEADVAFQRQYLDTLSENPPTGSDGKPVQIHTISNNTLGQVSTAMTKTMELISKYLGKDVKTISELNTLISDIQDRLKKLEKPA